MNPHSHLAYLSHGETKLGGASVPSLHGTQQQSRDMRSIMEKIVDVVDYLQYSQRGQIVSAQEVFNQTRVDVMGTDREVLDSLYCNPKIDITTENGMTCFQYRAKFELRNRFELLNLIDRIKTGVSIKDIEDCYDGIRDHISEMIVGGEVIAIKNKETKNTVLFPRGRPFIAELSGTVTATPGEQMLSTSTDLTSEIRRGDAILVGSTWFRVSSAVGKIANQPARAKAPLSVSSVRELSDKNVYVDVFDASHVPLDGDFDGSVVYQGSACKHGCTNDIREMWSATLLEAKPYMGDKELEAELLRLNLISRPGAAVQKKRMMSAADAKKERRKVKRRIMKPTNTHLRGTVIGDIIDAAEHD